MSAQLRILLPSATMMTPESWFKDMPRLVEECGRISHKTEDAMTEDSFQWFIPKIAQKLGHVSITDHVGITVKILGSRAMSHQLVRHRIAAYTQESQRYCDYSNEKKTPAMCVIVPPSIIAVPPVAMVPEDRALMDWRKMHNVLVVRHGKDGKLHYQREGFEPLPIYSDIDGGIQWSFFNALMTTYETYLFLREKNIPPEDARFVLPNASKTEVATTYDIHEWRHVLKTRLDKHAQWEIRIIMAEILRMFLERVPVFFEDLRPLLNTV